MDGHLARRLPHGRDAVAQALAFAFVIGSYFAAEWYRKRRVRRAARELGERDEEPGAGGQDAGTGRAGARARGGRGTITDVTDQPAPTPDELEHLADTVVGTVTLRAADLGRVRATSTSVRSASRRGTRGRPTSTSPTRTAAC